MKGPLKANMTKIEALEALRVSNLQNRALMEALVARRAMEPRHSQEDHECPECIMLADIKVLGRGVGCVHEFKDYQCEKCGAEQPIGKDRCRCGISGEHCKWCGEVFCSCVAKR